MTWKPTRPVPRAPRERLFSARYKVEPEDFVVEELPAYEPCGEGHHVFALVEKRGLSTFDLLDRIGAALDLHPRAIGYAGLKDARSVSRQWLSLPDVDERRVLALGDPTFTVLRAKRHGNKLQKGHLRGNRFTVRLRGAGEEGLERARAQIADLERRGVPNYFGEQRFGKRGANLRKGLEILRGNPRVFLRSMPRRLFGLMVSAVQSEVFNRVVIRRIDSLSVLREGDIAFLHRNGACFRPKLPDDQSRADALEISPTGPLPGVKMMRADGEVRALEQEVLGELDLDLESFAVLPSKIAPGDRRPLSVPLRDGSAERDGDDLLVSFSLPKGSYATAALREMLRETIWFAG
ncbi:MAG: tRNA pseudouridine(13) synthase TruD [Planctomycetota bacterium]